MDTLQQRRKIYNKRYRDTHKEQLRIWGKGKINTSTLRRRRIIERDGEKCTRCGTDKRLTLEHKKPICAGGTNEEDNLEILCLSCNLKQYHELVKKALRFYFDNKDKLLDS